MLESSNHKHYKLLSFRQATWLIYEREGLLGYYRGYLPSLIKNSLNSGTYFTVLYNLKVVLEKGSNLNEN